MSGIELLTMMLRIATPEIFGLAAPYEVATRAAIALCLD
jgi:hypothetical protein